MVYSQICSRAPEKFLYTVVSSLSNEADRVTTCQGHLRNLEMLGIM